VDNIIKKGFFLAFFSAFFISTFLRKADLNPELNT
jgi:hypothetical protein